MNQPMQINDWEIDKSAGRPILIYKGCSIIEGSDAEFVLSAIKVALSAEVQHVAGWEPPQDCERKEQLAFETWASSQHYDMHEHPLHYLFMDPKTDAARQGWKAALQYVRDDFAAAPAKQEGQQDDLGKIEIHLQKLIEADPYKARMASSNEDLRMWFVAELISEASGRIPLLEIEGLVSRHLAASKGGDA